MAQCEKWEEFSVEGSELRHWVVIVGSSKISLGTVTMGIQVKGGGHYCTMIVLWMA